MNIGITSEEGFVGWHLKALLTRDDDVVVVPFDKSFFSDKKSLEEFVKQSDVVVHLAGLNRGGEEEVYNTNIDLTNRLLDACKATGSTPYILFSSSTHSSRDTAYGRSKKECEILLREWAEESGGRVTNITIPNIYGEFQNPFYNSAVATFCEQLAKKEESDINEGAEVEVVYVQDVVKKILELGKKGDGGDVLIKGIGIKIEELYALLRDMKEQYSKDIIPALDTPFKISLFNTFRSYLTEKNYYPRAIDVKEDERGSLFETVKAKTEGQVFLSTTKPNVTRGEHFHTRKVERFCVLKGEATIKIRKIFSDKVIEYKVSGDSAVYVDMPTFYTHSITNTGKSDLLTLFWSSEVFDPNDPDTYFEKV